MAGLGGVGVGAVAARAHKGETLHGSQASEDGPDEEAKCDSGLSALAEVIAVAVWHADEVGHGDGSGEPEDCGDGENGKTDDRVVETIRKEGHEGEVYEHEERPNGVEKHEAELRGGCGAEVRRAGFANDISSETELDDEQNCQDGVDNGDDAESHDGG